MGASPVAQNPIRIRYDLEAHAFAALIAGEGTYLQLSRHKQLGALLDVDDAFSKFAKTADWKEVRLPVSVPHRQPEIAVLLAALPGLLEFTIVGGVADEKDGNLLVIQKSSPPLGDYSM